MYWSTEMSDHLVRRVDPRKLVSSTPSREITNKNKSTLVRLVSASLAAVIGLSAFGTMVVRANDDTGVLAFVRQQTRAPALAQQYRPAPQAYPVAYYAPRAFFPRSEQPRRVEQQKRRLIVASYAPFTGYMPTEELFDTKPRRKAAARYIEPTIARIALPAPTVSNIAVGGRVAYCVRTCDGFFFPISTTNGSDRADEAACNRLCPATETKLYLGQIGADIDTARARENGRKYASLSKAFSYRKSVDKSCSCTADGIGIATNFSVYRDGSLRVGDVIMTNNGMKVFNGGTFPYREANFTNINRSDRITAATRERLKSIELASLPGRSGIAGRSTTRSTQNEAKELKAAARSVENNSALVRYVGPDRSTIVQ
jgi:Protein of unknown function (DUF2865)